MMRWLLLAIAVLVALVWCSDARPVRRPPGVVAATIPVQRDLRGTAPHFQRAGFDITALARFELRARVLSREDYRFDEGADLAPVDLALGWGRMSDSAVLDALSISQGGRWWRWRADEMPIPHDEITVSAANMHLIPADARVETALDRVREGDIVVLTGYLVEAVRDDGQWRWRSSLTRNDTGGGSCELIWVESLAVAP